MSRLISVSISIKLWICLSAVRIACSCWMNRCRNSPFISAKSARKSPRKLLMSALRSLYQYDSLLLPLTTFWIGDCSCLLLRLRRLSTRLPLPVTTVLSLRSPPVARLLFAGSRSRPTRSPPPVSALPLMAEPPPVLISSTTYQSTGELPSGGLERRMCPLAGFHPAVTDS